MSNFSVSGSTSATPSTASSFALTPRYQYVTVENESATAGTILFVRTDGTAATVGGDYCVSVEAGERVIVANMLPLWTQAQTVIPAGANPASPNPGSPGEVQPFGSALNGQAANPGVSVSVISSAASVPFTITAAG